MEKVFNFGFIVLVIAGACRYFLIQDTGVEYLAFNSLQEWEKWFYGLSFAWFCLAFWNTFSRRRCSNCNAVDYSFNGSEEVDRWVGTKNVREKVGENSYTNRSVSTTFVKIKSIYECLACNHVWSETVKREKN